ncbi:MAG: hypothetical protein MZU84_04450 [Sphingobacterium sp.]|nr:hypothetical protein [Sphingobacterium sp.]
MRTPTRARSPTPRLRSTISCAMRVSDRPMRSRVHQDGHRNSIGLGLGAGDRGAGIRRCGLGIAEQRRCGRDVAGRRRVSHGTSLRGIS